VDSFKTGWNKRTFAVSDAAGLSDSNLWNSGAGKTVLEEQREYQLGRESQGKPDEVKGASPDIFAFSQHTEGYLNVMR